MKNVDDPVIDSESESLSYSSTDSTQESDYDSESSNSKKRLYKYKYKFKTINNYFSNKSNKRKNFFQNQLVSLLQDTREAFFALILSICCFLGLQLAYVARSKLKPPYTPLQDLRRGSIDTSISPDLFIKPETIQQMNLSLMIVGKIKQERYDTLKTILRVKWGSDSNTNKHQDRSSEKTAFDNSKTSSADQNIEYIYTWEVLRKFSMWTMIAFTSFFVAFCIYE